MGGCNAVGNVFRLAIVGGTVVALTMQFLTSLACDFAVLADSDVSVGIWHKSDGTGECVEEVFDTDDALITSSRSLLTISMFAGFAAGVMVAFEWLLCEVCCAGCLEGMAFLVAWLCGGAAFMFYGSELCTVDFEVVCEYGTGSTYLVIACLCYMGCGVLLCCAPQPDPICKQARN